VHHHLLGSFLLCRAELQLAWSVGGSTGKLSAANLIRELPVAQQIRARFHSITPPGSPAAFGGTAHMPKRTSDSRAK